MAFQQGEVYRCPDRECGCEIQVTKGAAHRQRRQSKAALLLRKRNGEG